MSEDIICKLILFIMFIPFIIVYGIIELIIFFKIWFDE